MKHFLCDEHGTEPYFKVLSNGWVARKKSHYLVERVKSERAEGRKAVERNDGSLKMIHVARTR
jgi:hypothetical protein